MEQQKQHDALVKEQFRDRELEREKQLIARPAKRSWALLRDRILQSPILPLNIHQFPAVSNHIHENSISGIIIQRPLIFIQSGFYCWNQRCPMTVSFLPLLFSFRSTYNYCKSMKIISFLYKNCVTRTERYMQMILPMTCVTFFW